MKRFLFRILAFLILYVIIIQSFEFLMPYYWGNGGMTAKMPRVLDAEQPYDTFFIGSSRVFRQIDPTLFDRLYGGGSRSFNLGFGATFSPEVYHLASKFIKGDNPKPKVIFLEIQNIFELNPKTAQTTRFQYFMTPGWYRFVGRVLEEQNTETGKQKTLLKSYRQSLIGRFLKTGMLADMVAACFDLESGNSTYLGPAGDGYQPMLHLLEQKNSRSKTKREKEQILEHHNDRLVKKQQLITEAYQEQSNSIAWSHTHLQLLLELLQSAENQGIELIFLISPRLDPEDYKVLLPIFDQLPTQNRINLGNPLEYPLIYRAEYSGDLNHLNAKAVILYTEYLVKKYDKIKQVYKKQ